MKRWIHASARCCRTAPGGAVLLALWLAGVPLRAARVVYDQADSLKVVRLVAQGRQVKAAERPLFFGRQFVGVPYVAATLEGMTPSVWW